MKICVIKIVGKWTVRENISGHMPEDREMPEYCPVRNFETYLQKLHPQCNRLLLPVTE
jgi:hypothetical protein